MNRIAFVLSLIAFITLPRLPAEAAGATLDRPSFTCAAGAATMRFSWRPADGATTQFIDVSLADNGFAPGTFISAGPFDGTTTSYTWPAVRPNVRHHYRVNALTPEGWQPAGDTFAAPCRPAEVSFGGRDAPFNLTAGVHVLDLATGKIVQLVDTRGEDSFYPYGRGFDWSPDGSQVAVIAPQRATFALRVYDATGPLRSEVKGQIDGVDWLANGRIAAHMRRGDALPPEEGEALVNPATGAIEQFLPLPIRAQWAEDGTAILFGHVDPGQSITTLFRRDVASGADRALITGDLRGSALSPDGRYVALSLGSTDGVTVVLDAATGAEVLRSTVVGYDFRWTLDSHRLLITEYGVTPQRLTLLELDGSSRTVARGVNPSWSPDGNSFTYFRDGAVWLTMLSDGTETALLRPQLPVIVEQRWSPAGDKLAFRVAGSGATYLMRSDGTEQRYLAPGSSVQWSPSGDRLAFIYGEGFLGFSGALYTMTPKGTQINRLGSIFTSDAIPFCWSGRLYDWSPDSSALVYATQRATTGAAEDSGGTYVVQDVPGARPVKLGSGWSPSWSSDGESIAYIGAAPPVPSSLIACQVMAKSPQGGEERVVVADGQAAVWSPDGKKLAVESSRGGYFTNPQIRIVAADGSAQAVELGGRAPAWSPDGTQIAYIRYKSSGRVPTPNEPIELVVAGANGSAPHAVAEVRSGQFDWSPDGTRLIYPAASPPDQMSKLVILDLKTGHTQTVGEGRGAWWSPDGQWIAIER
jgi:Tol biopolymer transport system component